MLCICFYTTQKKYVDLLIYILRFCQNIEYSADFVFNYLYESSTKPIKGDGMSLFRIKFIISNAGIMKSSYMLL